MMYCGVDRCINRQCICCCHNSTVISPFLCHQFQHWIGWPWCAVPVLAERPQPSWFCLVVLLMLMGWEVWEVMGAFTAGRERGKMKKEKREKREERGRRELFPSSSMIFTCIYHYPICTTILIKRSQQIWCHLEQNAFTSK
jgi:hypothetical protein